VELITIPPDLLPVLRRWREDRAGLSYLAGSHIILLQEDLPTAETIFVLYHEAVHSRLFNCALGFLLTSLNALEMRLAFAGQGLVAAGAGESLLTGWEPRPGFYSRQPRRPREFGTIPPNVKSHVLGLCREQHFDALVRAYLEIRRRRSVLLHEWRLPHEGLATLSEVSALRHLEEVREDGAVWTRVFGLEADEAGIDAAIRRRLALYVQILDPQRAGLPSPDQLIASDRDSLDPYLDGARFLFYHVVDKAEGLDAWRVTQLASQVPYGILPGLDDPFDHFLAVARDACSPTVRLGRLAAAIGAGGTTGTAVEDLLPLALAPADRPKAAASAQTGYYGWEWSALHRTRLMDPVLSLADAPDRLPYGQTKDQYLYHREPVANAGKVWVIHNDKAVVARLDRNLGVTPEAPDEGERTHLTRLLQSHLFSQSFERLVENIVSWEVLRDDGGRLLQWV
jgi:hypothetical protein